MPAIEEWSLENRDNESHVFHIHQTHFRIVEINGVPTSERTEQTLRDTIELPACLNWGSVDPQDPYVNDRPSPGKIACNPIGPGCACPYKSQALQARCSITAIFLNTRTRA
jgi:hypothetical protein